VLVSACAVVTIHSNSIAASTIFRVTSCSFIAVPGVGDPHRP
jgi:hypothetical protein